MLVPYMIALDKGKSRGRNRARKTRIKATESDWSNDRPIPNLRGFCGQG
jgi:hypothetical protein